MRILFVVPYVPSCVRSRSLEFARALTRLGQSVHLVMLRPPEDQWAPVAPVHRPLLRVRTMDSPQAVAVKSPRTTTAVAPLST